MPSTATDRLNGLSTSLAVKPPCVAVTSANITLAGLQTIGGVALAEGNRVLVRAQTNSVDNGIYNASTGYWTRAADFDGNRDVTRGTLVLVRTSTTDGAIYEQTTTSPVIGTSAIVFDLRDDPAITYAQIQAEIDALVTPVNYAYPPINVRRYGAKGDGTTDDSDAFIAALSIAAQSVVTSAVGTTVFVPDGIYKITKPLTLPDYSSFVMEPAAVIRYWDTDDTDSYCLTNGVSGARGGYCKVENLWIELQTATAKGVNLINSLNCHFKGFTYVQGFIPADWATNPTAVNARTNVGVRIEATTGQDCFFNVFDFLHVSHCHFGVQIAAGTAQSTQQIFKFLVLFGDSIYGDTTAEGLYCQSGQDTIVYGGYCEAYDDSGNAGAIILNGPNAVRIKVYNVVFDAYTTMVAVRITNNAGLPSGNMFRNCYFASQNTVVDGGTAADNNLIEGRPDLPGATWTASLNCVTSGTITLNSGAGGNLCYCLRENKRVKVWGRLSVASVSSPTGRLQIGGLPFTVFNTAANYAPVTGHYSDLESTGIQYLQGYAIVATKLIELDRINGGVLSGGHAADIKAGTDIMFSCEYITSDS